jgi:predicted MFS family arabinose efflux permease
VRIALNAQLLSFERSYRSGGISRVIYHLLAELGRDPRGHSYDVYAPAAPMETMDVQKRPASHVLAMHLGNSRLRAAFAIGFCILFAFIGTFTYVNFVLVRPPLAIGMMSVGFVYFVFAPSMFTTPLAGKAVGRWGTRPTMWCALGLAGLGLPLMLAPRLELVIAGMILVGVGTFLAQAVATGFVGRAAASDRAAASGLYLACYYCGGLAGTAVLGFVFDRFGWAACVSGVGLALAAAGLLTSRMVIAQDVAR